MKPRLFSRLSKFLSLILRHKAPNFGLQLDKHGWAPIDRVIPILKQKRPGFTRADLESLVRNDSKRRYEISGDKIRARYGHSLEIEPLAEPTAPPEVLYHGTSGKDVPCILRDGLKPMRRRFVHLSPTRHQAVMVGRRHSKNVVLLKIRAREAHDAGVVFYDEENTFLALSIPPEHIEVTES